jgi:hypothetical protein
MENNREMRENTRKVASRQLAISNEQWKILVENR